MKTPCKPHLLAAVLTCLLGTTVAYAQTESPDHRPLTPAAADGSASGGGTEDEQADLAKELQNPVANLISVPFQNNWDFGIGPADAMQYTNNIQPVIPVSVTKEWNLIIRTILPVMYKESPFKGGTAHSGIGDTTQSFFLSPKDPVGGWILGAGPVMYYPTASERDLGAGKWGAGPTIVALQQKNGFTYGILANQIWSYAGWGEQDISAAFLQPFLTYTTKTYTTVGLNTESTYNWKDRQWTVPLNFFAQQLLKIGKQPIAFQAGYRYYVEQPPGGPNWGLRFAVTFLFPKK